MQFNTGTIQGKGVEAKQDFGPREFIGRYLRYLPWMVVSIIICLSLAFAKLRYSTEIYEVSGKILIKKQTTGFPGDKFENMFLAEGTDNLKDEIEQIKSTSIAKRVVKEYDLQNKYYNKGSIRSTLIHRDDSPIRLEIVSLPDSISSYIFMITIIDDHFFTIKDNSNKYAFGEDVYLNKAIFKLRRSSNSIAGFATNQFEVAWEPALKAAKALIAQLNVSVVTDYSNVLQLKYETENQKIGKEIVNGIMDAYQDANLEDKKQTAVNALSFIDKQLDTLKSELGGVERVLQKYRETNKMIDPELQSSLYFDNMGAVQTQITDLQIRDKIVGSLISYIEKNQNQFRTVPASLGIPEPAMIQLINEYNQAQLQREILLKSTPEQNPVIIDLNTSINKLRHDIIESLINVRNSYTVSLSNLMGKSGETNREISTIPGKQKQLLEITRQQKILEELYSLLLQKKLETSISSASTIYNSRIIESSDASDEPIKPNSRFYYLIALMIGLAIPIVVIAIKELLNDRVLSKSDIEKSTDVPVLGEIGHAEMITALIMSSTDRSYIAEQFRVLRSNLQFFIPKEDKAVILVTSSFSGEGKSFISTNLGAVMALAGKKTIILEFDIRKPKILKGLGLNESKGITNFIVGDEEIRQLIKSVPDIENLYVIPCGPIPPNPSELLLEKKVEELFRFAKDNFDIVIVDTAPVGLISDAITLGQYVNSTIYIVRHNYTFKKQIRFIEEIYTQKKLPKLSIVINDVVRDGRYGQGYYGYSYGYGYGYGYGADYFDEKGVKRKRRWFKNRKR